MESSPRVNEPPPPWAGHATTLFVLLVAYCVTVFGAGTPGDGPVDLGMALPAGSTTAAIIALTFGFGGRLGRDSPRHALAAYFALQLAALAVLVVIFVEYRTFGMAWLYLMPLVAQARLLLPAAGILAVCTLGLGVLGAHLHALGGWPAVPGSLLGVATAVAFVLLFTDIAVRESAARAESQRLGADLERANRRLGAYAVHAEELATARERARMAREIHDSVGHSLTAVHMQLEAARALLGHDPTRARRAVEQAQTCVQDGLREIRRSVSSLRADVLAGRSLPEALEALAATPDASDTTVRVTVEGRAEPLASATALTLYRGAQEALTNVRKHARAGSVELRLAYPEPGLADEPTRSIRLTVLDDGVGLPDDLPSGPSARPTRGFGLLGLRERARQLGGRATIENRPDGGTRLEIEVPLERAVE